MKRCLRVLFESTLSSIRVAPPSLLEM